MGMCVIFQKKIELLKMSPKEKQILRNILDNNKTRAINALIVREYADLIPKLTEVGKQYGDNLSYYSIIRHVLNEVMCQNPECDKQSSLSHRYVPQSTCGSPKCKQIVAKINREKSNLEKYGVKNQFSRNDIQEKIKETNLQKYGVENPSSSNEIRKKIEQTNLEKFGAKYPLMTEESKKKSRDTFMKKHGFSHHMCLPEQKEKVAEKTKATKAKKKTEKEKNLVIPTCLKIGCDKKVKQDSRGRFPKYCSRACGNNARYDDPAYLEKQRERNMEKYGVPHPSMDPVVKEKTKNTNIERYGCENPFQSSSVKEKIKETNLEKYGVECISKNKEIRSRAMSTMKERYGVDNAMKHGDFKEKAKATSYVRYGTEHPMQSDEIIKKVKDTMNRGKVYADRNWLEKQAANKSGAQIGRDFNIPKTTIQHALARNNIKAFQYGSLLEDEVREFTKINTDVHIFSDRSTIAPFELDIYLPEHNLAIECNGSYWHSELNGKDKNYHLKKTKLCEEQGIQLIHIWEHDWIKNPYLVKQRLLSKFGKNERVYARKTDLKKITTTHSRDFLDQHHIQGTCPASVKYGLFENDELVAVMTFGKSRFSKKYEWELLRYCSTKQVVGGASKLFKHFQREYQPKSVVSYSDKMWNTGSVYKALGFVYSHTSEPAYYYTKDYDSFKNRVLFQKHKLKEKLEHFDPALTEWENMQGNGYDRIWDCGNDVWVWKCPLS
jgi:hypothetical protein